MTPPPLESPCTSFTPCSLLCNMLCRFGLLGDKFCVGGGLLGGTSSFGVLVRDLSKLLSAMRLDCRLLWTRQRRMLCAYQYFRGFAS